MTDQVAFLRKVVDALEVEGIQYMIVGSWASSTFGKRRTTHDIDIVFDASADSLKSFMARIASEEVYADLTSAVDAQLRGSQFNIIDLGQGGKIDLIFLKQDAFDRAAFQRRRSIATDAGVFFFQSPEDSILSKLRWSRLCGGSERQLADVAGVMATQWSTLDLQYLRFWAKELGVDGEFEDILAESKLMWPEGTA